MSRTKVFVFLFGLAFSLDRESFEIFIPGIFFWRITSGFCPRPHFTLPAQNRPYQAARSFLEMADARGGPIFCEKNSLS